MIHMRARRLWIQFPFGRIPTEITMRLKREPEIQFEQAEKLNFGENIDGFLDLEELANDMCCEMEVLG